MAIAADIHEKSPHRRLLFPACPYYGCYAARWSVVQCSAIQRPELFRHTCGGMGLTGIILQATFSLKKIETSYITQKSLKAANLDEIMDYFAANEHYMYSVAWIDCLAKGKDIGKSILMLGEHSKFGELDTQKQENPLYFNDNEAKCAFLFSVIYT